MMKILYCLLLLVPLHASAEVCFKDDSAGQRWYKIVKPSTATATAGSIKACAGDYGLRVESTKEDARCLMSAMAACDRTWGGVKLMPNPQVPSIPNQCLYFKVESGTNDAGTLYYRTLNIYDHTKIDANGVESCQ